VHVKISWTQISSLARSFPVVFSKIYDVFAVDFHIYLNPLLDVIHDMASGDLLGVHHIVNIRHDLVPGTTDLLIKPGLQRGNQVGEPLRMDIEVVHRTARVQALLLSQVLELLQCHQGVITSPDLLGRVLARTTSARALRNDLIPALLFHWTHPLAAKKKEMKANAIRI